jgi:hypothetical protein
VPLPAYEPWPLQAKNRGAAMANCAPVCTTYQDGTGAYVWDGMTFRTTGYDAGDLLCKCWPAELAPAQPAPFVPQAAPPPASSSPQPVAPARLLAYSGAPLGNYRGDTLMSGSQLSPGDFMADQAKNWLLVYQADGNLVLYDNASGASPWSTGTQNRTGGSLRMQADGNLVMYDPATNPYWSTGTNSAGPSNPYSLYLSQVPQGARLAVTDMAGNARAQLYPPQAQGSPAPAAAGSAARADVPLPNYTASSVTSDNAAAAQAGCPAVCFAHGGGGYTWLGKAGVSNGMVVCACVPS